MDQLCFLYVKKKMIFFREFLKNYEKKIKCLFK